MLYPTETVWGLGGRAGDSASACRIASVKGRSTAPLIVLVAEPPPGLPPIAAALAAALWPGPVTIVVPGDLLPGVALEVLAPDGTVGLRQSPHGVAAALVAAVGPLTSTSANRHGEPPLEDPDLLAPFVDGVAPGLPGGGKPSTVVCGATGRVLRSGAADTEVAGLLAALLPGG